jgi:hypothetical protein
MQIEKGHGHQVTVQSAHLWDIPGGKPVGLFARQIGAVRHSGEDPCAGNKRIRSTDFDERAARPDGDSGGTQGDRRV